MASISTTLPELISKIEGSSDTLNSVSAISGDDSVISASDDKTIKVWVKRDNNMYWPSVIQTFDASCSALVCEPERDSDGHTVFVGLGNGQVIEFRLSKDLNRFEKKKIFYSHTSRVTSLKLVSEHEWILSTSRDKRLQWSCTRFNRNLGTYESSAWCQAVEYDDTNKYAFVAEYNGTISVIKLDEANFHRVTKLEGHTSSVWALTYDPERRVLFSGGFDNTIVVWDIGSQQGTAFELNGHTGRIKSLYYSTVTRKLMSTAEDGLLGLWDMDQDREETAEWAGSDRCEKCGSPFFWNVRGMWQNKTVGVRQHHCRKCGRALCSKCSDSQSTFPKMGFERPVRMCQDCHSSITTADRSPMAMFVDIKLKITSISVLQGQALMITGGEDKTIRLWNISHFMH